MDVTAVLMRMCGLIAREHVVEGHGPSSSYRTCVIACVVAKASGSWVDSKCRDRRG